MNVPMFDQNVMAVRLTTERTPNAPITADAMVIAHTPAWGVACLGCRNPRKLGTSLSLDIAYVTRTPVFMQAKVVPITAMATEIATTIISAKPRLPRRASPRFFTMSPIGALEAAAASMPVTTVPLGSVPVYAVLIQALAPKYSKRYRIS